MFNVVFNFYLQPAKDNPIRVGNCNKPEYINVIKLPSSLSNFIEQHICFDDDIDAPYDLNQLMKNTITKRR